MKGKRFLVINITFLSVNLLLALTLSFLFYFGQSTCFYPIKTQAPSSSFVGQLRFPKDLEYKLEYLGKGIAELEFCGIDRAASSEGYDIVKIKQTLKSSVNGHSNFTVIRFCPEDDFWYIIYYPNFMEGKEPGEESGTSTVNYSIPPGIIKEPGLYAIGVEEKGYCKFEIK